MICNFCQFKTTKARYVNRNKARSCKHCCRGKAVLYILRVCRLSYPASEEHASYYVTCGLFGSAVFFRIIS